MQVSTHGFTHSFFQQSSQEATTFQPRADRQGQNRNTPGMMLCPPAADSKRLRAQTQKRKAVKWALKCRTGAEVESNLGQGVEWATGQVSLAEEAPRASLGRWHLS